MTLPVPHQLLNANNEEVLEYLAPLSCHGDNIEPLQAILKSHPDVESFCPDVQNYRFFLWYVGNTVFAYGVGMNNVSLRIPAQSSEQASALGVGCLQFDGENWYSFAFDCDQLSDLVKSAYAYAKP